jgi:hypothetical protein
MSGNKLVRAMRDGDLPPPRRPRGRNIVGQLIPIITTVAVGCFAYFSFRSLTIPYAQPKAAPAQVQPVANQGITAAWTAKDIALCDGVARAASEAPVPIEMALANRSVTDGLARLATLIECSITTKIERFCDPAERAALVAMINDYLGRIDIIKLGLGIQGAPMAVLGELFGGEIAAGSDIYNLERDATFAFIKEYNLRIAAGLQSLARQDIIKAADFSTFFGTGVPSAITSIFDGVKVDRHRCA